MKRVHLFHWHEGEAAERAERLRQAGFEVSVHFAGGGDSLRPLRDDPPDAAVIDLARLPSHGRAVGVFLRQQKGTRHLPLVFVEGDRQKTARVKKLLPDASYTHWERVAEALRAAIARPPQDPVVPGTMAGYSGTPLPRKLGIKAGSTVALLSAPKDFAELLEPLPEGVRLKKSTRDGAEVILLFLDSQARLKKRLPAAERALADKGKLWLCWPKKASGVVTDLTQNFVREYGLANGLVDYKIAAIDATWSGLCFARRTK